MELLLTLNLLYEEVKSAENEANKGAVLAFLDINDDLRSIQRKNLSLEQTIYSQDFQEMPLNLMRSQDESWKSFRRKYSQN